MYEKEGDSALPLYFFLFAEIIGGKYAVLFILIYILIKYYD